MIAVLVLVVALGYCGVCVLAGFGPPGTLGEFKPDQGAHERRFRQPAAVVADGYRAGAAATPGMRLIEEHGHEVLIDLRPTSRVLGGNFGLVLRLRYLEDEGGTRVVAESRNKVPFAWGMNHGAALRQAESALRMRAKRVGGLSEIVPGLE